MKTKALFIDGAMRNMGIVEAMFSENPLNIQILTAITYSTKPRDKSSVLSDGEHDVYCAKYLSECVTRHIQDFQPSLICTEIGSGAQSSRAASALGAMKGFMGCLMAQHNAVQWAIVTPSQAKRVVKKNADKDLIMAWVLKQHGRDIKWDTAKCRFEHQSDAVIIGYAGIMKYLKLKLN